MTTPMTVDAAQKLRAELIELKKGRSAVSKAIGDARKLGDLKENADYHAAKEKQGLMEARIRFIESKLSTAEIIDITKFKNTGTVIFGSTVTIENQDNGKRVTYRIVSEDESDVKLGLISNVSPMAKAMLGRNKLDYFQVGEEPHVAEWSIVEVEHV